MVLRVNVTCLSNVFIYKSCVIYPPKEYVAKPYHKLNSNPAWSRTWNLLVVHV